MARSSLWLYTNCYNETFCISAAEAQKYGAVPVCPPRAALAETAKHRIDLPDDCWMEPLKVVEAIVSGFKDKEKTDALRTQGMAYAREAFNLSNRADAFEKLFQTVGRDVSDAIELKKCVTQYRELVDIDIHERSVVPTFDHEICSIVDLIHRKDSKEVLFLGCGTGPEIKAVLDIGVKKIVAIDADSNAIAEAKKLVEPYEAEIEIINADLENEWTFNGTYDAVIAHQIVEHLKDPEKFVERAKSRVKPGGFLYAASPFYAGQFGVFDINPCHLWVYSMDGYRKLFGPKAEVVTNGTSVLAKWENDDD